jgi:hypothetical protein
VCVSFLHICLIVAPNPCHLVSVTPIINSFLSAKAERRVRVTSPFLFRPPQDAKGCWAQGPKHTHACGRPSSPHTKNYTFITADGSQLLKDSFLRAELCGFYTKGWVSRRTDIQFSARSWELQSRNRIFPR